MDASDRSAIRQKIAKVEEQLVSLARQKEEAEAELRSLRMHLAKGGDQTLHGPSRASTHHVSSATPLTPDDKVALFLRLFRGRKDVYPVLWQNQKTGRKGYAPACANEWVRGLCKKPRVKCGVCPNQAFLPVADEVILNHLQGRHVVGVYPMLTDETCWFLAADFDGEAWRDDVLAFTETCRCFAVPYAIERSRSGTGAHVWFFFSSPVAAAAARKMGSYLITETMARRYQLSMASYDRLFPNQDTLPKGGFGNLIALPLQYQARQEGNTEFLDDSLEPFPDQWSFLASLEWIPAGQVESIAMEATTRGRVIGLQIADSGEDDANASPWLRSPSRKPKHIPINDPIPLEIRGVLSQRLYVEKAGLPSPLINHIRRLAAFQNPEFYKKQNLRLSTALTPRVISCAEDHGQYISLPRGCLDDVQNTLREHKSHIELEDLRCAGKPIDGTFLGELTGSQHQAAQAILAHDNGVVVAAPGFGKTVLGIYLIARRKCSTLILVHRQPLLEQWRSQIAIFLGRSPILLTERKEHLEQLHNRLKGFVCHIVVLRGGRSAKERREVEAQLASIPMTEERLLLATGRYIGEGFDDARLDTLFLALPVSWKGTLVQYAGRLHRLHPTKREVRIIDYVHRKVPMLARMCEKRLVGYRAMGYREDDTVPLLE